eukprot:768766-Hanusia_phi.AAC.19
MVGWCPRGGGRGTIWDDPTHRLFQPEGGGGGVSAQTGSIRIAALQKLQAMGETGAVTISAGPVSAKEGLDSELEDYQRVKLERRQVMDFCDSKFSSWVNIQKCIAELFRECKDARLGFYLEFFHTARVNNLFVLKRGLKNEKREIEYITRLTLTKVT